MPLKTYDEMEYNPVSEKMVEILCQKTLNSNPLFFRVLVSYFLAKPAAMQRVHIKTHDRGLVPVNVYAINLASSGQGKGYSMNILEDSVLHEFRNRFLEETFPQMAEQNLAKLARQKAEKFETDPDDELESLKSEFKQLGKLAFSFDSATTPAVKQFRYMLLMAGIGALNLEIDEIGSNLGANMEVLSTFLELFDVGKVKQKLIKNTSEAIRGDDLYGKTPTCMLLFGTPSKVFDSGKVEDDWHTLLETGYARRCIFGYQAGSTRITNLTPEQVYDMDNDASIDEFVQKLAKRLGKLADPEKTNTILRMEKSVALLLIEYRQLCEKLAEEMGEHKEVHKAEMSHRYFKAMKLAGAYAFLEGTDHILEKHLYAAIKLVEDSGEAFQKMLTRDKDYVKLAKYMAHVDTEITHVDLMEDLPCYNKSESKRKEMIKLATAWGYKNNIIIKTSTTDGIEFLQGESLKEVNMENIRISVGTGPAEGYKNKETPFFSLAKFVAKGTPDKNWPYHWTTHHLVDGYRDDASVIQGFDIIALDIDNGTDMSTAKLLLKDYSYIMYTTKRHQTYDAVDEIQYGDRFRILLPMNYRLKLDSADYKEFLKNVFDFLPFKIDEQTSDRCRKWLTNPNESVQVFVNEGKPLDVLPFIPKTSKSEEYREHMSKIGNFENVERWFLDNTMQGNRSNQLHNFAMMLLDDGQSMEQIEQRILAFNDKLPKKLGEDELQRTVFKTVRKKLRERDGG